MSTSIQPATAGVSSLPTTSGAFVCGPTRLAIDRAIAAALKDPLTGPALRAGYPEAQMPGPGSLGTSGAHRPEASEAAEPVVSQQSLRESFDLRDILGEEGSAEHGFVVAALIVMGCLLTTRLLFLSPAAAGIVAPLAALLIALVFVASPRVRANAGEQPASWWASWAAVGVVWMPGLVKWTGEALNRGERTMLCTCWGALVLGLAGSILL